jgi:membrane protease YdiL (CAAX protease family)
VDAASALAAVIAVLVTHNVVGNLVLPQAWYIPANLVTTAVVVGGAGGVEVGGVGDGLAAGLPIAAALALAFVVATRVPPLRPLLADGRMAGVGRAETAYRALVRIPLGTVVLEEVAFRGMLLDLGGAAVSSVLFGLWHVLPTQAALDANRLARERRARCVAVAGAVVAMTAVGLAFCWLRLWTGSLVAPMAVHAAANSGATVAAYAVLASRR